MPRPIVLGVVGDSAAGKTTMTRGLVRALGEHAVTHACTDDYHRYDRKQRAELGITPLHPDCNHLDVMAQDLRHLRNGEAILGVKRGHGLSRDETEVELGPEAADALWELTAGRRVRRHENR